MKKILIILLLIFNLIFNLILYFLPNNYECFDSIPKVSFPFKNLFDDKGELLNIILISAPFREEKHEQLYLDYKDAGYNFCGISSYLNFPNKIDNPYEDKFHEKRKHDYTSMVSSWLYCFREPSENIKKLPSILLTEADLKDINTYKPSDIPKEYDYIYCCLEDNDKCIPGWQSYNRNWELGKKCLEVFCDHNLNGLIVGRTNCEFTKKCGIKVLPFLKFHEFQIEMQKSKFLFVPNISDASPRIITEALCYNIPVLVNYNIIGGWHNVVPGVTGEFFTDEIDIIEPLNKIINNKYEAREWFVNNRGKEKSGKILADFLIENYPNINNKDMKYATITI